ncbi:hypothetical protein HYPSUDRAFT_204389 [Hypholoma sublateritium FD-334 SS-4]|uniref:Uncharacterized protein n=1 Tax=Hypholoma sublateritium (strain FD-334 SS-4) TaxID=945553 RepID=A0A0D2KYW0_HYPSF|nr:hypothetical protein HYPSUDRAFT_204389 [Hypholoma sublateritium FD-334 SS-4]
MIDTPDFQLLVQPVVNFASIWGRIHADQHPTYMEYSRDFVHAYHVPQGTAGNPVPVDITREQSPYPEIMRRFNPGSFRVPRMTPHCRIHDTEEHYTFMCPLWKCPACNQLNPQHAPQLCPGVRIEEEPQVPWNQEVHA